MQGWTMCALTWMALLAIVGLVAGCKMPELTRVQGTQFPHPEACSECHVDIYSEWAHSPHAAAFVSEQFKRATDNYRFKECLGCHAPEPMLTVGQPAVREGDRETGVACVACHLDQGAMVGPIEPTGIAKPHPIRVDPVLFADGNLCGRCHPGTLGQWRASSMPNKPDCRHCHMPEVTRKITQVSNLISRPLVAAETAAREHRHSFSLMPDELKDGPCRLDVDCNQKDATITVTNLLPHDLPTGDFGVRTIQITADAIDSNGESKSAGRWELTRAGGASLAGGKSRSWTITLGSDAKSLRVEIARQGREQGDHVVLIRKEVVLQ